MVCATFILPPSAFSLCRYAMPNSQRPTIKAVTFDMDGLMFNTEDVYTLVGHELLRRRGHLFSPKLKKEMMGLTPQRAFEAMIRRHQLVDSWQQIAVESNALFLEMVQDRIEPMPGLFELFDALESIGIPKAVATSSSRNVVFACLDRYSLRPRLQFVLTAEDVTNGKPHPEVYQKAASRLGVAPAEMAVLEDSQNGCVSAASAGAFAVAVPGEHSRAHDFSSASLIIDTLADPKLYEALGVRK